MAEKPKSISAEDIEAWEEKLEGAERGRGGGGEKGKERRFGFGKRAKGKRDGVEISRSREKRKKGLERELAQSLPKDEGGRQRYRAWLEKVLDGKDAFSEDDVETTATLASGPGGQNVQKNRTAIHAKHLPTSLSTRAEEERSQEQNKTRAMEILKEKVEAHAEQWKKYEKLSEGETFSLFD